MLLLKKHLVILFQVLLTSNRKLCTVPEKFANFFFFFATQPYDLIVLHLLLFDKNYLNVMKSATECIKCPSSSHHFFTLRQARNLVIL